MGLKEIMVACDVENIASKKVIENNYGVFKDIVVQNLGRENDGMEYRYIINVDESLKKYNEKVDFEIDRNGITENDVHMRKIFK